jgi:hypothetical protein
MIPQLATAPRGTSRTDLELKRYGALDPAPIGAMLSIELHA